MKFVHIKPLSTVNLSFSQYHNYKCFIFSLSLLSSFKMDDKASGTAAQEVRSVLNDRVLRYQTLLSDNLTPLFYKELQEATRLHEDMLQRPDPTIVEQQNTLEQLTNLDNIDAKLREHWKELHTSLDSRTYLLANTMLFQEFLARSMLFDYSGRSPREVGLDHWKSPMVEYLNLHYGVGDKSDEDISLYQRTFAGPLKEMMLDKDHVEHRMTLAAARPTYPTGAIYRLTDQCDWPSLASILIKDRELAVVLYSQKPLKSHFYDDNIRKIVLRNIDEVRDKYFTELSSASTYTISKRAKELSVKRTTGQPPSSELNRLSEVDSAVATAKGIYNRAISSLGLGGTATSLRSIVQSGSSSRASSRASMDSTAQLIGSRNKTE